MSAESLRIVIVPEEKFWFSIYGEVKKAVRFDGEDPVAEEEDDIDLGVETSLSRIPAHADVLLERLAKQKEKKTARSKWEVPLYERFLERKREKIIRFHEDFLQAASLIPDKADIGLATQYDD
jgi:hypothetical protein